MKGVLKKGEIRGEVSGFVNKRLPIFVSLPIVMFGLLYYRHISIIIIGLLGLLLDIIWEYHATKKGMWSYKTSRFFMLFGRIPVEVPLVYFFVGGAVAVYILFRLGYVPGA